MDVNVFWEQHNKVDDCWMWSGPTDSNGYGYQIFHGTKQSVHRIAFELDHGPIADGMYVYRTCENRLCFRPLHLYLGTREEPWEDRFWAKVNKESTFVPAHNPSLENCWEWTASTQSRGYGSFCYKSKTQHSHRFLYEQLYGIISDGLYVLHKCDNKLCVRPDHLYAGTPKQNDADAIERGLKVRGDRHWQNRFPEKRLKGDKNPSAKLNQEKVNEIRAKFDTGNYTRRALEEEYQVSKTLIAKILRKELWV